VLEIDAPGPEILILVPSKRAIYPILQLFPYWEQYCGNTEEILTISASKMVYKSGIGQRYFLKITVDHQIV
jgi:hypothetical protein